MSIDVGSIVEGKVTGITNFVAFVELSNGQTGLVHISEVADAYVKDIKDYLNENDVVKVKVINVSEGRIGLSIKQANPQQQSRNRDRRNFRRRASSSADFEERLTRFLRDSDERLSALKKSQDSKRGGRGAR